MTAAQPDPQPEGLLDAALRMAGWGWFLLPVGAGRDGKAVREDLCPRWSRDSTTDPQVIASWLAGSQGVGIAVDLGRSGLAVVDGDHLERLDIPRELLVGAWVMQGNRARRSWMFRVDPERPVPSMAWMPWGEVKAAGSYVVLPPSPHHTGVDYQWLERPGQRPGVFPETLRPYLARPDEEGVDAAGKWDGQPATPEQAVEAREILVRQCRKVASAPPPDRRDAQAEGRNQVLNRAAFIVGRRLWALAEGEATAREWLLEASRRCGLVADDGELACRRSIRSGLAAGAKTPVGIEVGLPGWTRASATPDASDEASTARFLLPDEFWGTDVLRAIQQAAHSQQLGAAGLLGAVLARMSMLTDRGVELPGVPNRGSLNLLVGLVASSGGGKGSSVNVAGRLLPAAFEPCMCGTHQQGDFTTLPTGTGEGLVRAFYEQIGTGRARAWQRDRAHVLLDVDEIEALLAVMGRQGATIGPTLRSLWSGGTAGFQNSSSDRRHILDAGSYRVAMVAGVQPGIAGALFSEEMGGTPQRFIWLPAHGFDVPDLDAGEKLPDWPGELPVPSRWEAFTFDIAEAVTDEIALRRNRVLKGREQRDRLDAHRDFLRLRVAALLARLHEGRVVDETWWSLAGMVMDVSDAVRDSMLTVNARTAERRAERNGQLDAVRAEGKASQEAKKVARVAGMMWRKVTRDTAGQAHGDALGCPKRCALNAPGGKYPSAVKAEALEFALAEGWLDERDERLHLGTSRPGEG